MISEDAVTLNPRMPLLISLRSAITIFDCSSTVLFSIALVLFLFIMLINATLNFFLKRNKEGDK